MKTIVTHKKPHLDEVAAVWLLHRYHPDFKNFRLRFVAYDTPLATGSKKPQEGEILIGVGRGTFDEHSGKMRDCAATLVLKFLEEGGFLPREQEKRRALETLVEHVRMADFAENYQYPHMVREFMPEAVISGWKNMYSDAVVIRKGIDLLEALYIENREWEEAAAVWEKRVEFRTGRFKGAGVVGYPLGSIDRMAYDNGFDFIVSVDTKYGRRQFRASTRSDLDFTPVYNQLLKLDIEARWFLHHSGKLLISATDPISKLNLAELIDIAKRVL